MQSSLLVYDKVRPKASEEGEIIEDQRAPNQSQRELDSHLQCLQDSDGKVLKFQVS